MPVATLTFFVAEAARPIKEKASLKYGSSDIQTESNPALSPFLHHPISSRAPIPVCSPRPIDFIYSPNRHSRVSPEQDNNHWLGNRQRLNQLGLVSLLYLGWRSEREI